ncbi:MAG: UDP-N-acetylglucosamine 2-epimerase (non-hydrolyzing) [Acidobacteria bacterium]|nr:UDP-N-acetylglucosamine 2-epimerase (non-hydrolyzing) [Acidobacteriota bacterium]
MNARNPLKVAVIFGTRPEAIKLAPLIKRFKDNPERFEATTIVTAQHREMLDQVLDLFSIQPDYDLNIIRPRQELAQITARAIAGLDPVLNEVKPDFVMVQGDTTTTFIGALAAFYHKIACAHVEAGLRTHKKYYPYPEEINRQLTSVLSDAHFAPTDTSRQNLLMEGVPAGKIFVTGNTVIDALQDILSRNTEYSHPVLEKVTARKLRMVMVTSHRRENQGKPQEQICDALIELVNRFKDILVVFPVHLSPAVREVVLPRLKQHDRIVLLDPIDYLETAHFMKASHLILTDSGGIQEEAPALGKPVLVLRNDTERPEGLAAGTVRLAGVEKRNIVDLASLLLENSGAYRCMAEAVNPYGDGRASERILQGLEYIKQRAPNPEPFINGVGPQ